MKATGNETTGAEQAGILHAPPSIKNNPNVLPMPAELFNTCDDKENADIPQFYSSNMMVFLLDKLPSELPYGGFDDAMDTFHDNMGLPVRSQPHAPMNNFGMGRMRGGMQRHHPKPRMGGRGGKSMMPRIPHHVNPRVQMGNFQPY